MNDLNYRPTEWGSEAFFEKLNLPFDVADKIKMFLSTHPIPQWILRAFHNIWL